MKLNRKSWVTVLLVSMVLLVMLSPMAFGAEKKVVKIGFIGPLTGPNAAVGLGARSSADLAARRAGQRKSGLPPAAVSAAVLDDAPQPPRW